MHGVHSGILSGGNADPVSADREVKMGLLASVLVLDNPTAVRIIGCADKCMVAHDDDRKWVHLQLQGIAARVERGDIEADVGLAEARPFMTAVRQVEESGALSPMDGFLDAVIVDLAEQGINPPPAEDDE